MKKMNDFSFTYHCPEIYRISEKKSFEIKKKNSEQF